jgi:histidyl-tRNA synthetase
MGCELFGLAGPAADAEMMAMIRRFLVMLGLADGVALEINSLGCPACRPAYRDTLLSFLTGQKERLCGHCQARLERNPLRVLDCKNPGCREVALEAPRMADQLCDGCREHFAGLCGHLTALEVPHAINPLMVRGLDYYSRTAFEVTTGALGTQNAVAAGGRYDGLVAAMGGPEMPAVGFAMGVERLALLLDEARAPANMPHVYGVVLGDAALAWGLGAAESLRRVGYRVILDQQGGALRAQMKRAGRSQAAITLIRGENEARDARIILRDMATGEQFDRPETELVEAVEGILAATKIP